METIRLSCKAFNTCRLCREKNRVSTQMFRCTELRGTYNRDWSPKIRCYRVAFLAMLSIDIHNKELGGRAFLRER